MNSINFIISRKTHHHKLSRETNENQPLITVKTKVLSLVALTLSSGRKLQTTRKTAFILCVHIHPPSFLCRLESLPHTCPRRVQVDSLCHITPELVCFSCSFSGSSFEYRWLSKHVFNHAYFCCPAKRRNFQMSSHRKTAFSISCYRCSRELELSLLYAWETHETAQSCALIHGQTEDRQGRCCINLIQIREQLVPCPAYLRWSAW